MMYFIVFIAIFDLVKCANVVPAGFDNLRNNSNFLQTVLAYKRLESKLPVQDLREITTIGVLNGFLKTERDIEKDLISKIENLLDDAKQLQMAGILQQMHSMQHKLSKSMVALKILSNSIDLGTGLISARKFSKIMHNLMLQSEMKIDNKSESESQKNMSFIMSSIRKNLTSQVHEMQDMVDNKIQTTLEYILQRARMNGVLKIHLNQKKHKRDLETKQNMSEVNPKENQPNLNMSETSQDSMANQTNKQIMAEDDNSPEFFDTNGTGMGGGGLVTLITSLSGGEGGSDIGALIGALTGVISNIFGPNGLDIESLISTGTSLISGLLSGNKNFGTVLGTYVGTALDGLSGGGGAINNGQFLGNLLGTVIAFLSADPEDDDEPPKPLLFLQNLVHSFVEAKYRKLDEDEMAEATAHSNKVASYMEPNPDSASFIKQIFSSLTSGIVSIILNASFGVAGGASQASANTFSNIHINKAT